MPGAFDYTKEQLDFMTMLMLNANKLYDIAKDCDSDEAKAIVEKIEKGNPEDYRVKHEE
jgi:hypothetical protein